MPQRGLTPPCEQCDSLNNSLKKSKDVIRGLKLQITRLEEQLLFQNKNTSMLLCIYMI